MEEIIKPVLPSEWLSKKKQNSSLTRLVVLLSVGQWVIVV